MLVRDLGDAWQIVMQPDHADLAGDIAAAWGGGLVAPAEPRAPLLLAARRHDDGWAAWERRPELDEHGAPRQFTKVPARTHVQLYRAGIAVTLSESRAAGLLVSMHGSGLYRGRYGIAPGQSVGGAEKAPEAVASFLSEQDELQARLRAETGFGGERLRRAYALLQAFDVLSLRLCLVPDEPGLVERVPGTDGTQLTLRVESAGAGRVRIDPFPFAAGEVSLSFERRVLRKRRWDDVEQFRDALRAAPPERVSIAAAAS